MPGVAWMINCYEMKRRETTQAFTITEDNIDLDHIDSPSWQQ